MVPSTSTNCVSSIPASGISAPSGHGQASLSVRPEDVKLAGPGEGRITGKVTFIRDLGGTIETFLDVSGTEVVAVSTPRERPVVTVGQDVGIVPAKKVIAVVHIRIIVAWPAEQIVVA